MDIDLDLYRHEVRVSSDPLVRLSAIDISPELPERTFVFIHGFGGQAMQWEYQLYKFALKNRVIALDMRGHGLSDKPSTGYDMARIQLDLETALDLLKVSKPIVLVGHSFGGAIAEAVHPRGDQDLRWRHRHRFRIESPRACRAPYHDGDRWRIQT